MKQYTEGHCEEKAKAGGCQRHNLQCGYPDCDRKPARVFEMQHRFFEGDLMTFSEEDAPDWLTSKNTIKGSTMDMRWFWEKHILTLQVGKSVDTDFRTITRKA